MTFVLMSTKVISYYLCRGEPGYEARQIYSHMYSQCLKAWFHLSYCSKWSTNLILLNTREWRLLAVAKGLTRPWQVGFNSPLVPYPVASTQSPSPIPASCLVNLMKHSHCPSPQRAVYQSYTQIYLPKSPPLLLAFLRTCQYSYNHLPSPNSEREFNNQHEERCHRITGELTPLCQDCKTIHTASVHDGHATLDLRDEHQKGAGLHATLSSQPLGSDYLSWLLQLFPCLTSSYYRRVLRTRVRTRQNWDSGETGQGAVQEATSLRKSHDTAAHATHGKFDMKINQSFYIHPMTNAARQQSTP